MVGSISRCAVDKGDTAMCELMMGARAGQGRETSNIDENGVEEGGCILLLMAPSKPQLLLLMAPSVFYRK